MAKKNRKKSEIISDFLLLIDEARTEYNIAYEKVGLADKARTDLLHEIELCEKYDERNKAATKLRYILKDRRYYKDILEESVLLVDYYDEYKKAINMLKEVLGKMRKVEAYHSDRTYKPRFFKDIRKGD